MKFKDSRKAISGIFVAIAAFIVGAGHISSAYSNVSGEIPCLHMLVKGIGCVLVGILGVIGAFVYAFPRKPKVKQPSSVADKRSSVDGKTAIEGMLRDFDDFREKFSSNDKKHEEWTPEHTKPQTCDWDDGSCPYKRDPSKPLGSKENPVVAGVPSSSNNLVYCKERGCWILTDGLGNGWIR